MLSPPPSLTNKTIQNQTLRITGRHALVLAFRGTFSSLNMLTDLKLGQVPLPDMRINRRRRRRGQGRGEEEAQSLLGAGGGGGLRGGIFSPGTPPPAESGGRYGSAGALDRLTALHPAMRTASAGELRRLGGADEDADRYRRRASTPPKQPRTSGGSSSTASDAGPFVPASPVALPWAGPVDQRRASAGASPAALALGPGPAAQRRPRSTSADYGDGADDEDWGEGAEEALLQGLFDAAAAPSPSILGCGPSCRRSLSRLPALRHTLPHVHVGFLGAYTGVRAQLLVAIKRALDTE